jgi:hypothetical protein
LEQYKQYLIHLQVSDSIGSNKQWSVQRIITASQKFEGKGDAEQKSFFKAIRGTMGSYFVQLCC